MVADASIGVYFRKRQWFSASEMDVFSPRRLGFDSRSSELGIRLEEKVLGGGD